MCSDYVPSRILKHVAEQRAFAEWIRVQPWLSSSNGTVVFDNTALQFMRPILLPTQTLPVELCNNVGTIQWSLAVVERIIVSNARLCGTVYVKIGDIVVLRVANCDNRDTIVIDALVPRFAILFQRFTVELYMGSLPTKKMLRLYNAGMALNEDTEKANWRVSIVGSRSLKPINLTAKQCPLSRLSCDLLPRIEGGVACTGETRDVMLGVREESDDEQYQEQC